MKYILDFDPEIPALIRHLHPNRKKKIRESLRDVAQNPFQGKCLRDELAGFWSWRVGLFRIIYAIQAKRKVVQIVAIGPRRFVYEDVEREQRRAMTIS